jgi:CBS-domain-containing membrane protein
MMGFVRRDLAMAGTARSVADVMATDPVVLDPGASLEAADILLRSTFLKGIPVVDGQGRLVGTICDAHLAAHRFAQVEPIGGETGSASSGCTD